ncbi:MAG: U32 family peptidase [Clostridia bacterium]|nr:U32 family peptidase [Clostridia bacterium]
MNNKLEILAPGASFIALKAAIDSGADAVYFGGAKFGARANAINLSNDEISEAVVYAHLRGAKLYVTVNTLIGDSELEDAFEFLKFCYEAGVDAVIVQDLGIAQIIKKHFPKMKLHASTQMTIHSLEGVLQAEKLGFDRVVLSRELSFEEIKYIAQRCHAELEVFVHGALCMSYSGQCLFSSFLGGRSGNRGACAQPCRLAYTLMNSQGDTVSEKDKYLLSLRDLCLVDYIKELQSIGVKSLKIEGRMKSEAYVSAVCGIYNKYRDGGKVDNEDRALLENIFSRNGFTTGYYNAKYGRDMLSYMSNHDNIYESVTDDVIEKAKSYASIDKKIAVNAKFVMKKDEAPFFELFYGDKSFSAYGSVCASPASNMPATKERIFEQLSKLGGTVFEYDNLAITIDDGLYIPIKEINNVRREAFSKLESYILGENRVCENDSLMIIKPQNKKITDPMLTASVISDSQAKKAYELGFERIYIPYSVYLKDKDFYDEEPDIFAIKTPVINHDSRHIDVAGAKCSMFSVSNLADICYVKNKSIHADYRMNIFNSASVKALLSMGVKSFTLSPELTLSQMKQIAKSLPAEVVIYGKISLMTVRNCVIKSSLGKCGCVDGEIYYLKDRKNICFPVIAQKDSCTNVIYNSAPIKMSDRMHEIESIGASMYRFDFTDETPDEMELVFKQYERRQKADGFFTRGHFYNGVI